MSLSSPCFLWYPVDFGTWGIVGRILCLRESGEGCLILDIGCWISGIPFFCLLFYLLNSFWYPTEGSGVRVLVTGSRHNWGRDMRIPLNSLVWLHEWNANVKSLSTKKWHSSWCCPWLFQEWVGNAGEVLVDRHLGVSLPVSWPFLCIPLEIRWGTPSVLQIGLRLFDVASVVWCSLWLDLENDGVCVQCCTAVFCGYRIWDEIVDLHTSLYSAIYFVTGRKPLSHSHSPFEDHYQNEIPQYCTVHGYSVVSG